MKSEELRLGNYVFEQGEFVNITQIDESIVSYHGYEPIPLTEEILLKIDGVEELDNSEWKYVLKISAAKLYFRFHSGYCYSQFNDTYLGATISYLHELQNFCHVFKKEINIKL